MSDPQPTRIHIQNFVVPADVWTPITCPHNCDYFALWNVPGGWKGHGSSNVTLCSDPEDPDTQKPLSNGAQEIVAGMLRPRVSNGSYVEHRFREDDLLFYAKADATDTVLVLTCLL